MEQVGYVYRVYDDIAEVGVKRSSACGHSCEDCSGNCKTPEVKVKIKNTLNAKEGDYIRIKSKSRTFIKYTLLVYMVPFCMLIFGIFLGMYIFNNMNLNNYEGLSILVGLLFLGLSYLILKKIDKKVEKKEKINFEMVRIL